MHLANIEVRSPLKLPVNSFTNRMSLLKSTSPVNNLIVEKLAVVFTVLVGGVIRKLGLHLNLVIQEICMLEGRERNGGYFIKHDSNVHRAGLNNVSSSYNRNNTVTCIDNNADDINNVQREINTNRAYNKHRRRGHNVADMVIKKGLIFLMLLNILTGGATASSSAADRAGAGAGDSASTSTSRNGGRSNSGGRGQPEPRVCQEITLPMCRGIGYNYTYMPNQFHHATQEEAGLEVHQFWTLVEIQCSPDLLFFLCSMYTPICMTNYHKPLPPCRSVCIRAKSGCAPLMRQYGFNWPERMKCDDLPEFGDRENLCMDFNTTHNQQQPGHNTKPQDPGKKAGSGPVNPVKGSPDSSSMQTTTPPDCGCRCRMTEITNTSSDLYGNVMTGGHDNCAMTCKSPYFSQDERTFAQFWIGLWSILCCLSTTLTLITFLVDMQRFKYPERPIVFLSGCYFMVSIGFILRLSLGHEMIACEASEDGVNPDLIRYNTNGPALCTIVFFLIYFFSMASSIWWVILAFTWFLSAGLKWGQEAIEAYSQYFHIAAWLIPTVKSIVIIALKYVDGDSVAGICYVGNQNVQNLRIFILIPLCIYLLVGTTFLVAGFISLFRIRKAIKRQGRGQKTDKLEKLMIRIGIFTVLYTVPAAIVIACNFYDQYYRALWETSYNCPICLGGGQQNQGVLVTNKPDYSVFMLKYFMCLVVGITSGFWMWSGKTLESYRNFYRRICECGGRRPSGVVRRDGAGSVAGSIYGQHGGYHRGTLPSLKYPSPPPSTNPSYQSVKPMPLSHV